ncbi:KAP family P-loop NTPase fold protein [Stenotrophomonas sp. NPDC101269]|uniref:KAP family P-loop NTPase fold protein n=1 Tax=Stenotrophomonas TaxID=40323 RepID=UPI00129272B8|nr:MULTISPECIES: P-loop NTPase fold protein [Stenotrophomonas]MBD3774192.1 hypothetical protein [Paracoccaceae bacterium]
MNSPSLRKLDLPSIDPNDPWKDDVLGRQHFGQTLSDMIEGISQPYVISLKGEWGSGKSVFLRRLEAELQGRAPRVPVILVDAWKYDYYEDPLYALISAVEQRLLADKSTDEAEFSAAKQAGEWMYEYAGKIIAPLAKIAGATADVFTAGTASKFADGAGELGQALFNANREKRNAHQSLCKALEDARDRLLRLDRDGVSRSTHGQKVVVIIDELDRCRPDYAIRLLERVKHFFDLRGYLFVIAIDGDNLQEAVRSLYGPTVDGERYLRKFFDLEMYLPAPDNMSFNRMLRQSFGMLDSADLPDAEWPSVLSNITQAPLLDGDDRRAQAQLEASAYFEHIANAFNLKLRDQAQAFSRMHAAVAALGKRPSFMPIAAAFIVCLRYIDYPSYEAWRTTGKVPGIEGMKADCAWAAVLSSYNPVVSHALRTYLALASQGSKQMIDQSMRIAFKENAAAQEVVRRLPKDTDIWPLLLKESHREIFSLTQTFFNEHLLHKAVPAIESPKSIDQ